MPPPPALNGTNGTNPPPPALNETNSSPPALNETNVSGSGRRLLMASHTAFPGGRRLLTDYSSASWSSRQTFIGEDVSTVPDPSRVDQTYTELVGIYAVCDYPDRADLTTTARMWMIEVEVTMADFTGRSVGDLSPQATKMTWRTACTRAKNTSRRRGILNRMFPWLRKPANRALASGKCS